MVSLPQHLIDSQSQREEVLSAIEAWRELQSVRWDRRVQRPALANIIKVLQFIGLQCDGTDVKEGRNSTHSTGQNSPSRRQFDVELPLEGIVHLRGIPQFGSAANKIYKIVCTWNYRSYEVTALNWVTNSANRSGGESALIVIYLGGLTKPERNEIRRNCIEKNLSFAVLDEILFEFLTTIDRGSRFETFLNCALAYSAPNPYLPAEVRWSLPVHPEMFYGREKESADIENRVGGIHFVFGGRQVGKTALLMHIERMRNDTEQRIFTWFIDLRNEGYGIDKPYKDPREIWRILLGHFKEKGLTGEDPAQVSNDDIPRLLRDILDDDPRIRILAMFDESDTFLEWDDDSGTQVVEKMWDITRQSANRFKSLFAGLHSVQKYARRPNSPYRNLGFDLHHPRRGGLGPLKYNEAQRFVVEPMRAIGMEFEDPLLVDTILTHTECHPSELQSFCRRLVESVRNKESTVDPPYIIQKRHVDDVAANEDVLLGIRARYEETFVLDERYSAIALCMIHYYDAASPETLSVYEVREQVIQLIQRESLLMEFAESNIDDNDLDSLLNELVGLGILMQQGAGYRIRSPRIARVFGSADDVETEIQKLNQGRR